MSYTHEINDFRIEFENEEDYLLTRYEYLRGYNDDASGDIPFLMFIDREMYTHSITKPSIIYVITNTNLRESIVTVTSLDDPVLVALRDAVSFVDSQTPTGNAETTTTHETPGSGRIAFQNAIRDNFRAGRGSAGDQSNSFNDRDDFYSLGYTSNGYTSNPSYYSPSLTAEQIREQFQAIYPTEEAFRREYQATPISLEEDEHLMGKTMEEEPPKSSNIDRKPYFEVIDLD